MYISNRQIVSSMLKFYDFYCSAPSWRVHCVFLVAQAQPVIVTLSYDWNALHKCSLFKCFNVVWCIRDFPTFFCTNNSELSASHIRNSFVNMCRVWESTCIILLERCSHSFWTKHFHFSRSIYSGLTLHSAKNNVLNLK